MLNLKKLSGIALLLCLAFSCNRVSQRAWTYIVPQETSFIVIPAKDATLQSALNSQYTTLLGDISSSSMQAITTIDSVAKQPLPLKSILLYPGSHQKLQPIWITEAPDDFKEALKEHYAQRFRQNKYTFKGIDILNLEVKQRNIFASHFNGLFFLSESSLGIENAIRAYRGIQPAANLAGLKLTPGTIVLNTPSLDKWMGQLIRVTFHPTIPNAFKGTRAGVMHLSSADSSLGGEFQLSGIIPLTGDETSNLVSAISQPSQAITLDQYISSNAAAFGIFHAPVPSSLPESLPDTTQTDAYLFDHSETYTQLANTLNTELALVLFTESGFLSTGEHLFIRKVKEPEILRKKLTVMVENGLINKTEGVFFAQSLALAQLLGSPLCDFENFYLKVTGNAVVLSNRKGLAEMVASDRNRRRVITYEPFYQQIKKDLPKEVSSLFIAGPEFYSFLEPFLRADNYIDLLTSTFEYAALVTQRDESDERLSFSLSTFNIEGGDQPYREHWLFPIGDTELSGEPIFVNLGGSAKKEVVFATQSGSIYALAADGTVVQQLSTGSDKPVGSPVVYDWYGTGQNIILIAAGNKIYGWNNNGELLPQFPFTLSGNITSPLTIADIDNDGLPNAIVATANRQLHVLNGRGLDISGWPVTTHAAIQTSPRTTVFRNIPSVIAFAGNAAYGWNVNGQRLNNFPVFINASFSGAPLIYDDHIIGGAADGKLYAIGPNSLFSDSLATYSQTFSSSNVEAINVSNRSLVGTPNLQAEEETSGEPKLVTASSNGAVFLLNLSGKLLLTQNMGQPSAPGWSPIITDLNNNGSGDVVALADYGRLYAWEIRDGERIFDLPTAGMSHPAIGDMDGDGQKEMVAQTNEGVRCWTIL